MTRTRTGVPYSRSIQWIGSDRDFLELLKFLTEKNWWFNVRRQTTKQGGRRVVSFSRNITDQELGRWNKDYEAVIEIEHTYQPFSTDSGVAK